MCRTTKESAGKVRWLLTAVIAAVLAGTSAAGCSPKVVTRIEYRDRIEYQDRYVRDTIHETETVNIYSEGDTVYQTRTQLVYRERTIHDTAYVQRTDTIPYPVNVVEYVEKPLKDWQKGLMAVGALTLLALAFIFVIKILK